MLGRFCLPGWRWDRSFHTKTQTMCLVRTMIWVLAQNHHFDLKKTDIFNLGNNGTVPTTGIKDELNLKASLMQLSLFSLPLPITMPPLTSQAYRWEIYFSNSWVVLVTLQQADFEQSVAMSDLQTSFSLLSIPSHAFAGSVCVLWLSQLC